jgi:glutamine synthetase
MYGIKNKLKLNQVKPVGNAYEDNSLPLLPKNLGEAADRLKDNRDLKQFINTTFLDHYYMSRKVEYQKFVESVTDWEIKRYLEII